MIKIMTINDEIRDEKLQYDINRETSKISPLSSGNIKKYEYITGEDILPSDQQQMIEQAKFTYSPLGKAFEKQIKTIEDQREKQIKAIQDQKRIKKHDYDVENTPFISKQKEIFNELVHKRLKKIDDLNKKVNSNDLIYRYKNNSPNVEFNKFNNAFDIIDKIRDGKVDLSDVKNNQEKIKSYLGKIKKENKSKEQKNTLYNIEMLCEARKKAINFYDDYSLMMSEAKYRAAKGEGLKIIKSINISNGYYIYEFRKQ